MSKRGDGGRERRLRRDGKHQDLDGEGGRPRSVRESRAVAAGPKREVGPRRERGRASERPSSGVPVGLILLVLVIVIGALVWFLFFR
jgi:hypothetical protein